MCDVALEVLGAGGSRAALAAKLDVGKDSIYAWEKEYPEFSEAVLRGLAKSESLWESPDWCPDLHPRRWDLNMKNRFGWHDKTEKAITGPNGGPIQTENRHVISTAPEALKRMAKEYLLGESDDGGADTE
jgi:hypothetical protein